MSEITQFDCICSCVVLLCVEKAVISHCVHSCIVISC